MRRYIAEAIWKSAIIWQREIWADAELDALEKAESLFAANPPKNYVPSTLTTFRVALPDNSLEYKS